MTNRVMVQKNIFLLIFYLLVLNHIKLTAASFFPIFQYPPISPLDKGGAEGGG
jgi:hypothetical protein